MNNLIATPEYARLQVKREKRMRELMKEARNPGDTDKIMGYHECRRPEDTRYGTVEGAGSRSDNEDEKRDPRSGKGTGSTIRISSELGREGSLKNHGCAASRFGRAGVIQSLALEYAEWGVRINSICPGNLGEYIAWTMGRVDKRTRGIPQ